MSDYEAMRQEAVVKEAVEEERQGEAEAWRLLFGDQGILEVADEIERLRNAYAAVLATGREERAEIARLRSLNAELVETVVELIDTIHSLSAQQAMPDDFWKVSVHRAQGVLSRARAKEDT